MKWRSATLGRAIAPERHGTDQHHSAFEIFLRRPAQICEYQLTEERGVSPIDESAQFREQGQADLHRSVT